MTASSTQTRAVPQSLRKINVRQASEIYQHFELTAEAATLEDDTLAPEACLGILIEAEQFEDAVRFLAHALPRREAVWWACLAARTVTRDEDADPRHQAALEAAESWVFEPVEANRRKAELLAEKTRFRHPSGWAAVAAFWSGASITAETEPPVPPPTHLYAHAVTGAVMLAASLDDPNHVKPKLRAFLKQGMDIANGGNGQIRTDA